MTLSQAIEEYKAGFREKVPADIQAKMANATQELTATGIVEKAPKAGDTLPNFNLPNHLGKNQSLSDLVKDGPVIVTFYRGGWCPYCNLELRAYQEILPDIQAAGANLVAITPELPDNSLSTVEKNDLAFSVLTDENADYARSLGLVFSLPEELRPIYSSFGIEIEQHNGDGQFDLPLAATYLVNKEGVIAYAFVDADYTKREEPRVLLEALNTLSEPA